MQNNAAVVEACACQRNVPGYGGPLVQTIQRDRNASTAKIIVHAGGGNAPAKTYLEAANQSSYQSAKAAVHKVPAETVRRPDVVQTTKQAATSSDHGVQKNAQASSAQQLNSPRRRRPDGRRRGLRR